MSKLGRTFSLFWSNGKSKDKRSEHHSNHKISSFNDQQSIGDFITFGYDVSADVIGCEKIREEEKYIVYIISVIALGHEFTIQKRYSDFRELHKHFKRYKSYNLSGFPKKTFISRFDDSVIDERLEYFTKMIEFITRVKSLWKDGMFFEFLELFENVQLPSCSPSIRDRRLLRANLFPEEEYMALLDKLNFATTEFLSTVNEISELYSKDTIKMSQNNLGLFLMGDTRRTGLIKLCFEDRDHGSHLQCGHSLALLLKLISPARNSLGEHFLRFFCSLKADKLLESDLGIHLQSPGLKKCKLIAFEILSIFLRANPKVEKEKFFSNEFECRNFNRWLDNQTNTSVKNEKFSVLNERNIFFGNDFGFQNISRAQVDIGTSASFQILSDHLDQSKSKLRNRNQTELRVVSGSNNTGVKTFVLTINPQDCKRISLESIRKMEWIRGPRQLKFTPGPPPEKEFLFIQFTRGKQRYSVHGYYTHLKSEKSIQAFNFTSTDRMGLRDWGVNLDNSISTAVEESSEYENSIIPLIFDAHLEVECSPNNKREPLSIIASVGCFCGICSTSEDNQGKCRNLSAINELFADLFRFVKGSVTPGL